MKNINVLTKEIIEAYEEALKVYTFDRFPTQYAIIQSNLGNAYNALAEVEDKSENWKRAIKAYEEALKVFTKEKFPKASQSVNVMRVIAEINVAISTQTSGR